MQYAVLQKWKKLHQRLKINVIFIYFFLHSAGAFGVVRTIWKKIQKTLILVFEALTVQLPKIAPSQNCTFCGFWSTLQHSAHRHVCNHSWLVLRDINWCSKFHTPSNKSKNIHLMADTIQLLTEKKSMKTFLLQKRLSYSFSSLWGKYILS